MREYFSVTNNLTDLYLFFKGKVSVIIENRCYIIGCFIIFYREYFFLYSHIKGKIKLIIKSNWIIIKKKFLRTQLGCDTDTLNVSVKLPSAGIEMSSIAFTASFIFTEIRILSAFVNAGISMRAINLLVAFTVNIGCSNQQESI